MRTSSSFGACRGGDCCRETLPTGHLLWRRRPLLVTRGSANACFHALKRTTCVVRATGSLWRVAPFVEIVAATDATLANCQIAGQLFWCTFYGHTAICFHVGSCFVSTRTRISSSCWAPLLHIIEAAVWPFWFSIFGLAAPWAVWWWRRLAGICVGACGGGERPGGPLHLKKFVCRFLCLLNHLPSNPCSFLSFLKEGIFRI